MIKTQISSMVQLAKIDGNFDRDEYNIINKIAKRYDLTKDEFDEIIRKPESVSNFNSLTLEQKVEHLYHVIHIAKADRRILPNEVVFCQQLATRLGFKKSAVQALIPLVKDNSEEFINFSMIKQKIGPFL